MANSTSRVINVFIATVLIFAGCKRSVSVGSGAPLTRDDVIQEVIDQARPHGDRLLIIAPHMCINCIAEKVNAKLADKAYRGLDIIVLDPDAAATRRLSAIYARHRVVFHSTPAELIGKLSATIKGQMEGFIVGVRVEDSNQITLIDEKSVGGGPRRGDEIVKRVLN